MSLIVFFLAFYWLTLLFLALTLFVCYFFRNPKRDTPKEAGTIIAPADGRIIAIEDTIHPLLSGKLKKISTFMSVLNCHVNRVPVDGSVENVAYKPGRFFVASLDKASEHNERNTIIMKDGSDRRLAIVQIAGVVARRIVCYLKEGACAGRGERLGLIRFGSRVDLFLQADGFDVRVKKGDRVRAGETILGRYA